MELTELARAVLLSPNLEDKLVVVNDGLTDLRPGPALARAPAAPARPHRLALGGGRRRARFPGRGQLVSAVARGRALHFFANHELLAMELMALVLLRFPDAPAAFRNGVAHTLREEQDHLRRYRARMHELGVELGDVPVSDFFWSTMADMASPLDYVVRMSMTFEQANLDHALHYAQLFREVEDLTTAQLMDLVYEEEIGHVQHGVTWFNRWRQAPEDAENESDWDAYRRLLSAPLTPRRAKGHPYAYGARLQVGLSEAFATELEIFSHTRGRPPVIWFFEPDFEAQERARAASQPPPPTTATAQAIASDLAPVLMFLAASDDVVVTPVRPQTSQLTGLARAGFEVPELLEAEPASAGDAVADRPISGVEGWAETAAVRALRTSRGLPDLEASSPHLSSKLWASELLGPLCDQSPEWASLMGPRAIIGTRCGSIEDVTRARATANAAGFERVVLKRPFSTSGQGRQLVTTDQNLPERWLRRALADGAILMEPWLERCGDLSVLLEVTDRDLEEVAPSRVAAMPFLTGRHGVYRGHILADPTFGLPDALKRRLSFGVDGGFATHLANLGAFVRRRMAEAGFRGPAAIDLLIYRQPSCDEGWGVKPIVEINARRTMGHVAWALKQRLAPGRVGVWLHRPTKPSDAERVSRWPAPKLRESGRRGQLTEGLVATTDPGTARQVWSFLAVGESLEEIRALIGTHLDTDATRALPSR